MKEMSPGSDMSHSMYISKLENMQFSQCNNNNKKKKQYADFESLCSIEDYLMQLEIELGHSNEK